MSTHLSDQPWMTRLMDKVAKRGGLTAPCANCGKAVSESEAILDDAYGVWRGRCPYCNAINLLDQSDGSRGYWSGGMNLCLPTDHEVKMNNWEGDIPVRPCTCGACTETGQKHAKPVTGDRQEAQDAQSAEND